MDHYHLFQDQHGQVLAIEARPEAFQRAPKDRLIKRMSTGPVNAEMAETTLQMFGGILVYADRPAVTVAGRYSFC